MVIAAGRAYQDLIRWIKGARPRTLAPWRLARRLFGTSILGATVLLGLIGLVSPDRFGSPGRGPQRGPEWWALSILVTICLVLLIRRRRRIAGGARRVQETFHGALRDHPSFEPAASALDSCPAALRTRFALGWVWGPAAILLLGAIFATSSVYFVVDAILARFDIGWQQVVLTAVDAVLSLLFLRGGAKRLSVWRLSFTVHRAVRPI